MAEVRSSRPPNSSSRWDATPAWPSLTPSTARVALEPLLSESCGDGGVQSLRWHDEALRQDADGDWAHAFFEFRRPRRPRCERRLRSRL
ncbi:hypothetical protein AB1Y20_003843 [Prymnesium parvum]|uniref:Uncharacterized protein n=1 Tax=Prymnesium parvum TaxID=97485 RepID=A0AB34J8X2_PRYPA